MDRMKFMKRVMVAMLTIIMLSALPGCTDGTTNVDNDVTTTTTAQGATANDVKFDYVYNFSEILPSYWSEIGDVVFGVEYTNAAIMDIRSADKVSSWNGYAFTNPKGFTTTFDAGRDVFKLTVSANDFLVPGSVSTRQTGKSPMKLEFYILRNDLWWSPVTIEVCDIGNLSLPEGKWDIYSVDGYNPKFARYKLNENYYLSITVEAAFDRENDKSVESKAMNLLTRVVGLVDIQPLNENIERHTLQMNVGDCELGDVATLHLGDIDCTFWAASGLNVWTNDREITVYEGVGEAAIQARLDDVTDDRVTEVYTYKGHEVTLVKMKPDAVVGANCYTHLFFKAAGRLYDISVFPDETKDAGTTEPDKWIESICEGILSFK